MVTEVWGGPHAHLNPEKTVFILKRGPDRLTPDTGVIKKPNFGCHGNFDLSISV